MFPRKANKACFANAVACLQITEQVLFNLRTADPAPPPVKPQQNKPFNIKLNPVDAPVLVSLQLGQ